MKWNRFAQHFVCMYMPVVGYSKKSSWKIWRISSEISMISCPCFFGLWCIQKASPHGFYSLTVNRPRKSRFLHPSPQPAPEKKKRPGHVKDSLQKRIRIFCGDPPIRFTKRRMSQRQELFNFFDFHGTGWISHEDLKQVLGQEFLELKPLFFWVTKVGFRVSFDGKNGGKPSMFFEKRQQEGSVQQGGPKQKGLYTKSNCGESYLFFCSFYCSSIVSLKKINKCKVTPLDLEDPRADFSSESRELPVNWCPREGGISCVDHAICVNWYS